MYESKTWQRKYKYAIIGRNNAGSQITMASYRGKIHFSKKLTTHYSCFIVGSVQKRKTYISQQNFVTMYKIEKSIKCFKCFHVLHADVFLFTFLYKSMKGFDVLYLENGGHCQTMYDKGKSGR